MLLVAGTHGNEVNAPWLFDQWDQKDDLVNRSGLNIYREIGNPLAREVGRRYIDRDLNRSFSSDLFNSIDSTKIYEINRAKQLLDKYGFDGENPCNIALDFHSTTAFMGCCLVVYGRRPADLALAALIQHHLGLPIYLHEGDPAQKGFLAESWPCGLVIEIGPVPQGLLHAKIIQQTRLSLEVALEEISKVKLGNSHFPEKVIIHRHLKSVDFPRDFQGLPKSYIHEDRQGKDWIPIHKGDPLFGNESGETSSINTTSPLVPLFINEAAYLEKNIAMSLSYREVWDFKNNWFKELKNLVLESY